MDLVFAIQVMIGLTDEPDNQPHGEVGGSWPLAMATALRPRSEGERTGPYR